MTRDLVPTLDPATSADDAAAGVSGSGDARSRIVSSSKLTGTKGGSGVWQRIISEMPEHDVFIEPFWGRGTITKAKRPAAITIGIDLDPDAISDGDGHAMMFLADGVQWLKDYFRLCPSPAGGSRDARGSHYVAAAAGVATFGGITWERHFVYLDPPYLGCTGYYRHELSEDQHRDLCRVFKSLPCPAALSGYASDLYAEELGFQDVATEGLPFVRSIQIPTVNRAGRRVTEWLWLNFEPPVRYHDVRFVGVNRRERERIRRRVRNWSDGLKSMTPAERQAVWEACAAVYCDLAGGESGSSDIGSTGGAQPPDSASRSSTQDSSTGAPHAGFSGRVLARRKGRS
ncbi:MAG: hypothetical protein ACYC4U_11280 [Pirellulaceae bacterium]